MRRNLLLLTPMLLTTVHVGCAHSKPAEDASTETGDPETQNDRALQEDPDSLQSKTVEVPPPERLTTESGAAQNEQDESFDPPQETP